MGNKESAQPFHQARFAFDASMKEYVQQVSMLVNACNALIAMDAIKGAAKDKLQERLNELEKAS